MAQASLGGWSPARTDAPAADGRLPWVVWLYLAAVMIPVAFDLGPLHLTGLRVLLLMVMVPLTWRLLMGRYDRLYVADVLFLVHAGWVFLALVVDDPGRAIQNGGIYAVEFYGGYVLARATIRGPERFGTLIRVLVILAILTLPLTIHESLTGRPLVIEWLHRLPVVSSVDIISIPKRLGLERVQSVFAHPIHYGLFASSIFSLCYIGLLGQWGAARRIGSAALVGACCFLALSSGAFLALLMQLFLIGWAMALAGVRARWWVLIGSAVAAYVTIDLLSNRTPVRVFFSYATFSPHNAYWRGIIFEWGMKNVNMNPLFGVGFGNWIRPSFMRSGSMDNFWLVMAVRFGYPGFLTIAGGYLWTMWRMSQLRVEADPVLWRYRRAWMFTFVGLTFTLCTVHIWTSVFSFVFFLFGAGMWMLAAKPGSGSAVPAAPEPARPSRYARFAHGGAPASARGAGGAALARRPAADPERGGTPAALRRPPPAERVRPGAHRDRDASRHGAVGRDRPGGGGAPRDPGR
jgi:O-antigen ligase